METTQKLKLSDLQVEGLQRSKKHAELTTQEIKVVNISFIYHSDSSHVVLCNCVMTVSYTHLDVYKRQADDRVRRLLPFVVVTNVGCITKISHQLERWT